MHDNHIPTLSEWWSSNLQGKTKGEFLDVQRKYGPPYTYMHYSGLELFNKRNCAKNRADHKAFNDIQSEFIFRREEKVAQKKFEAKLIDAEEAKPNPSDKDTIKYVPEPNPRPFAKVQDIPLTRARRAAERAGETNVVNAIDAEIAYRRYIREWD